MANYLIGDILFGVVEPILVVLLLPYCIIQIRRMYLEDSK